MWNRSQKTVTEKGTFRAGTMRPFVVCGWLLIPYLLTGCAGHGQIPMTTEIHGRMTMAETLIKTEDYQGALRQYEWVFEEYLKTYPRNVEVQQALSLVLFGQEKWDEAARAFEEVVRLKPRHAGARFGLGTMYLKAKNRTRAKENFQKALELDPKHAHALNSLGYLYIEDGRVEDGMALVQQAYDKHPDHPSILDSMGWGYFKMGKTELGRDYLLEAGERSKSPEIQRHLGDVYEALGDHDKAAFHRQQAVTFEEEEKKDKTAEILKDVRSPVLF